MVLVPSTLLPVIPSQPTITKLIVVKLKEENGRQKSNQQHGLKFHHLFVFLWCRGCVLHLGNEGVKG
jgi:hypothetical protein